MAATIQTIEKPTKARALDTSSNNNHGQIYSGRALEFDGVTDYLENTSPTGLPSGNTFTIVAWVNYTGTSNDWGIWRRDENTNNPIFRLSGTTRKVELRKYGDESGTANTSLKANTWYRVLISVNNLVSTFYVNGVADGTHTFTGDFAHANESRIGEYAGNYITGMLSDIQVWDTAWTADDALYDYNNPEQLALNRGGTSLTNSNLKLWYPMNDGHRGQQSYILDASNTGLSDNLVVDGNFPSSDNWTLGDGMSINNNLLSLDGTQTDYTYAYQQDITNFVDPDLIPGTWKIVFTIDSYTDGSVSVGMGGYNFSSTFESTGTHTVYIKPTNASSNSRVYFKCNANFVGSFSNIEVYKVNNKNHATTVFYGDEIAVNGSFAADSDWTKGTGWTIGSGTADCDGSQTGNSSLSQTYAGGFVEGRTYQIQFTISDYTAGNINPHITGTSSGNVNGNGTKTSTIVATSSNNDIVMYADSAFDAKIDDVSVKEVGVASGWTDADQQLDIPQTALQSYNQLAWFDGYASDTAATLDSQILWEVGQTINMWVYPNVLNQYDSIFGDRNTRDYIRTGRASGSYSTNDEIFQFEMHDNLTSVDGNDMRIKADGAGTLEVGKWLMWTFIWNADRTVDWYENGQKKGNSPATADTTDGKKMEVKYFGAGYGTSSQPFEGAMTEISHYTDILTQSEINDLYNDGKAKSALEASGSGGLSLYLRNNSLAEWKDLKGSNDANVDSTETMLITAGADATRDSQGFLMNRQRATNSLNLDYGENGFVEVPDDTGFSFADDDGDNDSAFSITAWVYMEDCSHFKIANKLQTSNQEWIFHIDSNDKLYLTLYDNSTGKIRGRYDNTTLTSREGEWVHLACTYSGDESDPMAGIDLYIDGTAVDDQDNTNTGTYSGMERKTANLIIGAAQTNSKYSNGKIDDLCIYSKELSATEVTRNYNAGKRSHR